MPLRVSQWPPPLMRCPGHLPAAEVELYIGGVFFGDLLMDGNYAEFTHQYLMRETKGVWGRVIYERYAALGGDTTFIRGKLWLARHFPGYPAPPTNRRAKVITDSDDEDPNNERVVPRSAPDDGGNDDGYGSEEISTGGVGRGTSVQAETISPGIGRNGSGEARSLVAGRGSGYSRVESPGRSRGSSV